MVSECNKNSRYGPTDIDVYIDRSGGDQHAIAQESLTGLRDQCVDCRPNDDSGSNVADMGNNIAAKKRCRDERQTTDRHKHVHCFPERADARSTVLADCVEPSPGK